MDQVEHLSQYHIRTISYFVIEGPDGVGKSTLIQKLIKYFNENSSYLAFNISPCNNAYGNAVKQLLRQVPRKALHEKVETQLQLSTLENVLLVDIPDIIDQHVDEPKSLILFIDRWVHSTGVYQYYTRQPESTRDPFIDLSHHPRIREFRPDGVFILDAPDSVLDERLGLRDQLDRYEEKSFQKLVRSGYRAFKKYSSPILRNAEYIDVGSEDIEVNFKKVLSEVLQRLK